MLAIGLGALLFAVPAAAQQGAVWINPDIVGPAPTPSATPQLQPGAVSPGPQRYRLPFNKPSAPVQLTPPGTSRGSVNIARPAAPRLTPPAGPRAPVTVTPQRPVISAPATPPATAAAPSPAPAPAPAAPVARAPEPQVPAPAPTPAPVAAAPREPEATRTEPRVIRPTAPATIEAPTPAPPPPSAEPATPPRQVATAAPVAAAAAAEGLTRVLFQGGAEDLDASGRAAVRAVAERLKGTSDRVQIKAYADSETETEGWKRRLSLRRGNNVRLALLDEGVQSFRILLRALGAPTDGGQGNRVDLIIESR